MWDVAGCIAGAGLIRILYYGRSGKVIILIGCSDPDVCVGYRSQGSVVFGSRERFRVWGSEGSPMPPCAKSFN